MLYYIVCIVILCFRDWRNWSGVFSIHSRVKRKVLEPIIQKKGAFFGQRKQSPTSVRKFRDCGDCEKLGPS